MNCEVLGVMGKKLKDLLWGKNEQRGTNDNLLNHYDNLEKMMW
jgi:hypothetical protein